MAGQRGPAQGQGVFSSGDARPPATSATPNDTPLAGTINGPYEAEVIASVLVIWMRPKWPRLIEWMGSPAADCRPGSGNIPPAEAEAAYYRQQAALSFAA